MKKINFSLFSLLLLSGTQFALADEPPPPNEDQFLALRQEIDELCHSAPPCEESRLYCFLEQVHSRREAGTVDEPLFRRLLHEGQMRLSYHRGFQDGRQQCQPPGPRPGPRPTPGPTPAPKDPEDSEKVKICHRPPGNPDNAKTLSVGASAVSAHIAHGDSLGECSSEKSDKSGKSDKGGKGSKGKSSGGKSKSSGKKGSK